MIGQMISCSHWGMFEDPLDAAVDDFLQRYSVPLDYLAYLSTSYDAQYLHGTYQRLNFGPNLS